MCAHSEQMNKVRGRYKYHSWQRRRRPRTKTGPSCTCLSEARRRECDADENSIGLFRRQTLQQPVNCHLTSCVSQYHKVDSSNTSQNPVIFMISNKGIYNNDSNALNIQCVVYGILTLHIDADHAALWLSKF